MSLRRVLGTLMMLSGLVPQLRGQELGIDVMEVARTKGAATALFGTIGGTV